MIDPSDGDIMINNDGRIGRFAGWVYTGDNPDPKLPLSENYTQMVAPLFFGVNREWEEDNAELELMADGWHVGVVRHAEPARIVGRRLVR